MITKMSHATVYVLNQQEALEFYTNKLGFEVRTDATMEGGFRWLTVGPKDQPDFEIILMEPSPGFMLDEATSALDSESEALVREALDRLMRGRTVLVIAHRLSTVTGADRVAVLEGGRVVQLGSHARLLTEDGPYRRLVEHQVLAA